MIRPRRSALYMPGSNARALEKARALPADGTMVACHAVAEGRLPEWRGSFTRP